jgi:hypothetical protein
MSDSNMITAYSWAAGLVQQDLPSSLIDVEKRAKLVNEINVPLVRGKNNTNSWTFSNLLVYVPATGLAYLVEEIFSSLS